MTLGSGQVIQFVVCVAEISTILASTYPSSSLSKQELSLLVWNGGKPENLHISNAAAIGLTSVVLGIQIKLITYRHLGRFFRFEVSNQKDHELIVSGPYSVVRHPSYTGLISIFGGFMPWNLSNSVSWARVQTDTGKDSPKNIHGLPITTYSSYRPLQHIKIEQPGVNLNSHAKIVLAELVSTFNLRASCHPYQSDRDIFPSRAGHRTA